MGIFKPPAPPGVNLPPPAAHPSTLGSASVQLAGQAAKAKAAAAEGQGFDDTIKTSPQGTDVATPSGPSKPSTTLLGG